MTKPCPKYDRLLRELQNEDEYARMLNWDNEDLITYVNKNAGTNGTTVFDILYIGDVLRVEVNSEFTLYFSCN
jgi:hypothetical protein